jgi:Putative neutral zinc metallopeptidase/LysM domain
VNCGLQARRWSRGESPRRAGAEPASGKPAFREAELQADCFAGIWGHSTDQRKLLDPDDVRESLNAAAAVGDDRLQQFYGDPNKYKKIADANKWEDPDKIKAGQQLIIPAA